MMYTCLLPAFAKYEYHLMKRGDVVMVVPYFTSQIYSFLFVNHSNMHDFIEILL